MLKYILPISILSSTIMGAGMFFLPFIFYSVGFLAGFAYLLFFSFIFWILHSMYADIILRTDHEPHFVSYVRTYLGKWAYWPSVFATVISILLVLTIYLMLAPSFAKLIDGNMLESYVVYGFWALGSFLIFVDIKKLEVVEFLTSVGIFLIIFIVFLFGSARFDAQNIELFKVPASLALFFLPFGPILFSLSGRSAIAPVLAALKERGLRDASASKIIFWGTVLPALFYLLFIIGIFGLSDVVSEDSVSGITKVGGLLSVSLGVLGLMAIFSTYIPLGISVKNVLVYDLKLGRALSGAIVVVAPMAAYLLGARNFLFLVALSGGVFLAFESLLIVLIWGKLNSLGKERALLKYFGKKAFYLVAAVFAVGMIYELIGILLKLIFQP